MAHKPNQGVAAINTAGCHLPQAATTTAQNAQFTPSNARSGDTSRRFGFADLRCSTSNATHSSKLRCVR